MKKSGRYGGPWVLILLLVILFTAGCRGESQETESIEQPVHLIWYQIGGRQQDMEEVLKQVNAYTSEKIGVTVEIIPVT